MKPQVYVDSRPPEFFGRYHERVRSGRPDGMYEIVRIVLTGPCWLLYRAAALGSERIPHKGPLILAPNHFSNLDHFFLAMFLRRQVQFMAKSQLFKFPIDSIMNRGGTFPVRRGQHDVEAFKTAYAVLDRGGMVAMYAEGGRSRTKRLGKPKSGLGRLALESGVPVVPVAIHGSEHAREVDRLRFPKVTIMFGEPLVFEAAPAPDREHCQWASVQVFERVRQMHDVLSTEGRKGARRSLEAPRPQSGRPEPELLAYSQMPEREPVLTSSS